MPSPWKTCSCGREWRCKQDWRDDTSPCGWQELIDGGWLEVRMCPECRTTTAGPESLNEQSTD